MNKKRITIMTILTLVLAFMDISGLPAVLFINCRLSDVTPYIMSLLVNFLIIGFFAWLVLKSFGKDWPLGLHTSGLVEGLKNMISSPNHEIPTSKQLEDRKESLVRIAE